MSERWDPVIGSTNIFGLKLDPSTVNIHPARMSIADLTYEIATPLDVGSNDDNPYALDGENRFSDMVWNGIVVLSRRKGEDVHRVHLQLLAFVERSHPDIQYRPFL